MRNSPVLVTCGLPYTNGPCHIGHLRTYVPADFYVRYLRRVGEDVIFICGSDNHGTPVVVSAEEAGVSPRELCERFHTHFDETFRRMQVRFDHFGMTDDPTNHARTRKIVGDLIRKGYIYSQVIQQSYCTRCARFLPDRYVEGICPYCGIPARGDECDQGCGRHLEPGEVLDPTCGVCGTKAENREQEHYFFKLSEFKTFLLSYLDTVQGTINARNYALGWVKDELRDWCITRTLDWGVKFPGRDDLVVYVWVDAPIGYISFTEEWAAKTGNDWRRYWCGDTRVIHFIGGDIIYHHCIFWPALLKGAGYGIPHAVVASGMVKVDDHKFSKSRGYVVWTNEDYLDRGLPPDYLRYYLLAYTNHTKELNFSWKVFQERVNNELVNTLGNFVYRTLYFAHKEFGGVPDGETGAEIRERIGETLQLVDAAMREYEFKTAIDSIMTLAAFGNNYITLNAPWKLIKTDPDGAKRVIRNCLSLVHALTLLIEPVLPEKSQRIWAMLGHSDQVHDHLIPEAINKLQTDPLPAPKPVFEKLDDTQIAELEQLLMQRVEEANKKESKMTETISFEDFCRMDIRIGRIISTEPVPKSSKLLKIVVDIGAERRQIVAGIAPFYKPEDLIGKEVTVLVNLAPATILGVQSNGMILAAGDTASLLVPLRDVEPGAKIR
jgi:methionyl-tRNA synthetase